VVSTVYVHAYNHISIVEKARQLSKQRKSQLKILRTVHCGGTYNLTTWQTEEECNININFIYY